MNTAITISWDVDGTTFSETFDEHEVAATPVLSDAEDIIKTLHTGKPSRVSRTGKNKLSITFILHATGPEAIATLSKLKNIDAVEDTLSVYYKYIADNSVYIDCVLPKGQIPDEMVIAGMNSGRKEITVAFYEA
jgi:hypothetical protein